MKIPLHSTWSTLIYLFLLQLLVEVRCGSSCANVECDKPPKNTQCIVVPESDGSISRPSGKNANCCPLWQCWKDNLNQDFFTFHGLAGGGKGDGSETVQYQNQRKQVSSVATDNHDAKSNAGGDDFDVQNAFEEINKAISLGGFGF